MAFASLFTLLDDIATVLDDVAVMAKIAAKKTAGVVGDDLALNANQVTGVRAERELPIVWAVAKGSLINKLILIPIALLLAVFMPMLITPLLMVGGAFLCFEGVEKLLHKFLHSAHESETAHSPINGEDEADKIKGAIRTDFILSAEIIIIVLGTVETAGLMVKIVVLTAIGIGMTALVYGLVAAIVKADDFGAYLVGKGRGALSMLGNAILWIMPFFMRGLSVIGTIAMFLVGGGIFAHKFEPLHHWLHAMGWDSGMMEHFFNLIIGLLVGAAACAVVLPLLKWWENRHITASH